MRDSLRAGLRRGCRFRLAAGNGSAAGAGVLRACVLHLLPPLPSRCGPAPRGAVPIPSSRGRALTRESGPSSMPHRRPSLIRRVFASALVRSLLHLTALSSEAVQLAIAVTNSPQTTAIRNADLLRCTQATASMATGNRSSPRTATGQRRGDTGVFNDRRSTLVLGSSAAANTVAAANRRGALAAPPSSQRSARRLARGNVERTLGPAT